MTCSPLLMLAIGGVLLVLAVVLFVDSSPGPRQWLGATCLLVLAAVSFLSAESTRFVFDSVTRSVRWHRRTLFGVKEGEIPFSDITEVTLESDWNDEPVRGRRLTLVTRGGRVPLSRGYTGLIRHTENLLERA